MAEQDLIEVRFRISEGIDIGPIKYSLSISVASLKENVLSQWPKEMENGPRTINDLKLINAGRILENNMTLGECRLPVDLLGGIITMHVVVRSPHSRPNSDREQNASASTTTQRSERRCSCTIS